MAPPRPGSAVFAPPYTPQPGQVSTTVQPSPPPRVTGYPVPGYPTSGYPSTGYPVPSYYGPGYGVPDPYYGGSPYGYDPYGYGGPSPFLPQPYGYGYPGYFAGEVIRMLGGLTGNGPLDEELTPEEEYAIRQFYQVLKRMK